MRRGASAATPKLCMINESPDGMNLVEHPEHALLWMRIGIQIASLLTMDSEGS
jgi:hypothetical protein